MTAPVHDFPTGLRAYLATRRGLALVSGALEVAISCFSPARHTNGDANPSLRVDLAGAVWRCDVCGEGAGAVELVMGYERCDRAAAIAILAELGGTANSNGRGGDTRGSKARTVRGGRAKKSPDALRALINRYRRAFDTPSGGDALAWLSTHWKVARVALDRYVVGLAPIAHGTSTTHGGRFEAFQIACPSTGADLSVSGIKLYRPQWKELGGDPAYKAIAERGSSPGLFGGHLLRDAAGRTVVVMGGEKDVLVAFAALEGSDAISIANARGEGGWKGEAAMELAGAILRARPARVVVALDVNESGRGAIEVLAAFARAASADPAAADPAPTFATLAWPRDFAEDYPKGGAAQFVLGIGAAPFRALVASAPVVLLPSAAAASDADTPQNRTDRGNAQRMVSLFCDQIRFVAPASRWFIYDGTHWAKDETGSIQGFVGRTIDAMFKEAAAASDQDERKALFKHALAAESARSMKAIASIAQADKRVAVLPHVFDRDPWLLTVANGTVDLRTGAIRRHASADLVTKITPIRYDPAAKCPLWLAFLDAVFGSKADLIEFIRRAVGYSLTGSIREQVVFFLYGTGANGKSTFLDVFRALVGDYGQTADFSSFTAKDKEVVRNDLADLAGARLVTAAETAAGQRLDEAVIKKLTGGDPIKARFLFREHFTYTPTFKLWLATNHRPVVRGGEHAIWRRIRLVPFEVTFADHEQDRELVHKLRAELPGILAWAVGGCLDWQRNGLTAPGPVIAATEEYREDMDAIAVFKKDRMVEVQGARIAAKELYEAYNSWAKENGETPYDIRVFGRLLNDKGIKSYKVSGTKFYRNVSVRVSGDSGDSTDSIPNACLDARTSEETLRNESVESPESPLTEREPGDDAEDRPWA